VHNDFAATKKIKEFSISLLKSLGISIIAGLFARLVAFPIMALLHNRWVTIISYETVDLVYLWVGQIVGSLVFVIYMYIDLRGHNWSKLSSILAVIILIVFLFIFGSVLSSI